MGANESPVLVMVDTETSMVFAHVCKRTGAGPDILETLMEDIDVLGHRQIVFKSDQGNPVTAVQRSRASTTGNEVGKRSKVPLDSKRHCGERGIHEVARGHTMGRRRS